ncbi:MAG: hypothetical protein ABSH35_28420, partial [Isosphaeraceae bacterium]
MHVSTRFRRSTPRERVVARHHARQEQRQLYLNRQTCQGRQAIVLQFRRKPAVGGKRGLGAVRFGGGGLGWVGHGFMQQAARLA